MSKLIKGIHHVALKCKDMDEYEKVKVFYGDILEIPVIRTWDTGIMFNTGNGIIEIFNNGEEQLPKGTIRHFAFATDNVDACVDAVTKAGYEVFNGPKDIIIGSVPPFPARIAFCNGPLGEEIEFFEEK